MRIFPCLITAHSKTHPTISHFKTRTNPGNTRWQPYLPVGVPIANLCGPYCQTNQWTLKKFKLTWKTLIANHHFLNHPKFSSKEISRNSIWSVPSDFCNFKASCHFSRMSFLLCTFSLSTGWGSIPFLLSNLHNLPSLATQQAICYAFIPSFIGPLQAVCWRLFSFRFGILHTSHFGFAWRTLATSITFIWKRFGKLWSFFKGFII